MSGFEATSENEGVRVAVPFRMFGPYILARLGAAAEVINLVAIEGSHRSTTYAWEPATGDDRFERHTLFTNAAIEDTAAGDVMAAVGALLDRCKPDVVCVGGWSFPEALAMLKWAAEKKVPTVLLSESTAGDRRRIWWRESMKRFVLRFCSAALVGGAPHARYVATLGMSKDRVFVGYDAVDNDYFEARAALARATEADHRRGLDLPERFFLLSSRFIGIKNLDRMLDAYGIYRAQAKGDPWHLVLLGDGEDRSVLEAKVDTLGLRPYVQFKGFRQYDELPAYYALAGAFVHVATVEPWGLVVNEAMASGLPVIVSDRCGCAEDLVEHGVNGYCVNPFDAVDIADKLVELASDDVDRAAMGRRSQAIVAAWGPKRFAQGLLAATQTAVERPVRSAGPLARWLIYMAAMR